MQKKEEKCRKTNLHSTQDLRRSREGTKNPKKKIGQNEQETRTWLKLTKEEVNKMKEMKSGYKKNKAKLQNWKPPLQK